MKTVLKVISQTNVAERVVGTGNSEFKFNQARFFGYKNFSNGVPVNNVSGVHLGVNTGELAINLSTGENKDYLLNPNKFNDLYNWHVQGHAGDGCYVIIEV